MVNSHFKQLKRAVQNTQGLSFIIFSTHTVNPTHKTNTHRRPSPTIHHPPSTIHHPLSPSNFHHPPSTSIQTASTPETHIPLTFRGRGREGGKAKAKAKAKSKTSKQIRGICYLLVKESSQGAKCWSQGPARRCAHTGRCCYWSHGPT